MKNKLTLVGKCLVVSLLCALPFLGHAKIAGKPVILVHGFWPATLGKYQDNPSAVKDSELSSISKNQYWNEFWWNKSDGHLYWSSADRLSGGIKNKIKSQINNMGTKCKNGCVLVTHSTGDLVTRYLMKNLGAWGLSSKFKVLAVIDLAGAGGGTEIADIAYDISVGSGAVNSAQRSAIKTFLGFTPKKNKLGVLYDLRPNTARNTAKGNSSAPRLRFVGTGWENGGATKPFLKGMDDSVVPLHSSCMATSNGSYDSCSKNIANNGVLKSVSKAPSGLWHNHHAILMGEKTNHGGVKNNKTSGEFATVKNNFNAGPLRIDFDDYTEKKWWSNGKKVRWVKNGNSRSMSKVIYDTLNN